MLIDIDITGNTNGMPLPWFSTGEMSKADSWHYFYFKMDWSLIKYSLQLVIKCPVSPSSGRLKQCYIIKQRILETANKLHLQSEFWNSCSTPHTHPFERLQQRRWRPRNSVNDKSQPMILKNLQLLWTILCFEIKRNPTETDCSIKGIEVTNLWKSILLPVLFC